VGQFLAFMVPVDGYVITNDGTRGDKVAAAMGVPPGRVHFWLNGIKKEWSELNPPLAEIRREIGVASSSRIVLTVSRLESWKRVDRIIAAFPQVLARVPDARLVVVGEGTQKDPLAAMAESLGILDHVDFVGAVPHESIWRYMYAADVFVSVNELTNLVSPVLEAMTCSKCVVSLADGSLEHIIESGKTGWLLPLDRADFDLARVIVDLLERQELARRMGHEAREYALSHFWSWDERLNAECCLLESLSR
jgi:glycosyltransferase involved in cell wall biosynthesis